MLEKILRNSYKILLTFALCWFILCQFFMPSEKNQDELFCQDFEAEWYRVYEDGTREKTNLPQKMDSLGQEEIVVETKIMNSSVPSAYLVIKSQMQNIRIFVDGELRLEYAPELSRLWGDLPPSNYVFCPINLDDAGKNLTMVFNCREDYVGNIQEVFYATQHGFWTSFLRSDGTNLVIALLMLILSVIVGIVSVIVTFRTKRILNMQSLSLGIFMVASWMLANSVFRQLFFRNVSALPDLSFFLVMLIPIPFAQYMNMVQNKRYNFFYGIIVAAANINFLFQLCLQIFRIRTLRDNFIFDVVIYILLVILVLVAVSIDIAKKKIREYWVTALLLALTGLVGVGQFYVYYKSATNFNLSGTACALIFLLLNASFDSYYQVLKIQNEKANAITASEMKSKFLANMSHEIRTPINAVLGMNEMIIKESKESNIVAYAEDVKSSGRMLLSLINDILDFSKIESGKLDLIETEYELGSLINDMAIVIRRRIEDKNLKFTVDVDPNIPHLLYGDDNRVKQIIINLLTNAVKYTDKGNISITFEYDNLEADAILLRVIVKDTGRGIKEEDVDKLFESFQRVDEKNNRNIEGTGLGLAITANLTKMMNGKLSVDSTYGQGSTFTAEIVQGVKDRLGVGPYKIEENPKTMSGSAERTFKAPSAKILAVDDVSMNLKVFCNFLKDTSIIIDSVTSGKEAIELWKTNKYDIVFLDHMMPEMDGIECIHIMQQEDNLEINKDTPVIMFTANAIAGIREEYINENFTDYLSKPVKVADLKNLIIKYLPKDKIEY